MRTHKRNDAVNLRRRKRRNIFAIIDRQIGLAVGLVRCERASRNSVHDFVGNRGELHPPRCALLVGNRKTPDQPARFGVVAHIEGTVFADDAVDRPHPRDVIAPSCRPSGNWYDDFPRAAQTLERAVGEGGDAAAGRQRVIDVGEDKPDPAPHRIGHCRQGRRH